MTEARRLRVLCLPTGPDEYAIAMVRALSNSVDVILLASPALIERFHADIPPAVEVHVVPWPRHRDPRNLILLARILTRIQIAKPDVIHFLGDSVVWLALAMPVLRRWPVVVTVHDVTYHPGDSQSQTVPMSTVRLLRRAADAIIVHGLTLADDLTRSGIRPKGGIYSIPHIVLDRHVRIASQRFLERRASDGTRRILFFGRVMAYKGLGLLIEASDRVLESMANVRFVVAGRGPDLDQLRPRLEERPWFEVHDRYVDDVDVAQLFLDADLVVLPYVEASQSGVVAIAAAFGVPVVATEVGELGKLVRTAKMGIVAQANHHEVAEAIQLILRDEVLHWQLATASKNAASTIMCPKNITASTIAVYNMARAEMTELHNKQIIDEPEAFQ